jgi:hypothetical protein
MRHRGKKCTAVVVPSPPPKVTQAPKIADVEETAAYTQPVEDIPQTFTVGVTDYTFNTINAIFGRLLKTPNGHVVTLAYWQQKESVSHDEIPYYEHP